MKRLEKGLIIKKTQVRPDIWSIWIHCPGISNDALPGQFVHVRIDDSSFVPLLRRPLSIGRIKDSSIELVWRVVGTGTDLLSKKETGQHIDLLGPLGNPFTIPDTIEHAILIGGGLGSPPMVCLNDALKGKDIDTHLFIGVRGENDLPYADIDPVFSEATIYAEEGGKFYQGLVTEPVKILLEEIINQNQLAATAIYSCGPWGLVKALQKTLPQEGWQLCEVSLESQMACGIGVCQGCAVRVEGGLTPYQLVCHDGPVFDLFSVEVPNG